MKRALFSIVLFLCLGILSAQTTIKAIISQDNDITGNFNGVAFLKKGDTVEILEYSKELVMFKISAKEHISDLKKAIGLEGKRVTGYISKSYILKTPEVDEFVKNQIEKERISDSMVKDQANKKRIADSISRIQEEKGEQIAKEKQRIANEKARQEKRDRMISKYGKVNADRIFNHEIWIGMTIEMLKEERGKPDHVNVSNYGSGNEYQWCWDDRTPSCFYGKSDWIITSFN